VTVAGSHAYVANWSYGMQILDISSPSRPWIVGSIDTDSAVGVAVSGNLAFIADEVSGLRIVSAQCGDETPISITNLEAAPLDLGDRFGVRIRWDVHDAAFDGFRIERSPAGEDRYLILNPAEPIPTSGPWEFLDETAAPGESYDYRLIALLPGGEEVRFGPAPARVPGIQDRRFFPPSPNPMVAHGTFRFRLPAGEPAQLRLFDVAGRRLRTLWSGPAVAGTTSVDWNGRDEQGRPLPSGIYLADLASRGHPPIRHRFLLVH
jgi:hypothetical protein